MIKEVINTAISDVMVSEFKKLIKSLGKVMYVDNSYGYWTGEKNIENFAVDSYVAHLMKGIYPNGYSKTEIKKDDSYYGIIGKYRIDLYDGDYLFFLNPTNILIISVTTESRFITTEFDHGLYREVMLKYYGNKAAYYENKIYKAIDDLVNLYIKRNKKMYNQMSVRVLSSTDSKINIASTSFDKIVFDDKDYLIQTLDVFRKSRDMYNHLGIQYKLGILLYGKPGTGKSTLARAIAEYLNRTLFIVRGEGISYIHKYKNAVILIEEIDRELVEYVKTSNGYETRINQKILKLYLTQIDLVGNDVVLIATTNHIENLDDALIRDGRFDIRIKMDDFRKDQALQMCELCKVDPSIVFSDDDETETYNPAVLQNRLKEIKMTEKYINDIRNSGCDQESIHDRISKVICNRTSDADKAIFYKKLITETDMEEE